MSSLTLRNWNRLVVSRPTEVADPASPQDLSKVVTTAQWPIRAAGHFHSVNPCFTADGGTQVSMHHFNDIDVDLNRNRIRVGAATNLLQIREALRPHGLELAVMPEIGDATAGAMACAGTKDSSLFDVGPWSSDPTPSHLAQVGSAIVEIKLVDARGRLQTVSGADELPVIRSGYGLLGIVYEVTFATQPAVPLRTTYEWIEFDARRPPSVKEIFGQANGVLGFLDPYRPGILVERRTRAPQATVGSGDELKRSLRDWAWEWGATEITASSDKLRQELGRALDHMARRLPIWWPLRLVVRWGLRWLVGGLTPDLFRRTAGPLFTTLEGFNGYRSDSVIDFSNQRPAYFDFTFWAFPVSGWSSIMPAYLEFCRGYREAHGFRPGLFTEVYFICRDRRSLLSFSPVEPIFTLDMVHSFTRDQALKDDTTVQDWRKMNQEFNAFAVRHGGRPLLNQTKELEVTPRVVGEALGSNWAQFKQYFEKDEANQKFLNGYFRRLLDPKEGSAV